MIAYCNALGINFSGSWLYHYLAIASIGRTPANWYCPDNFSLSSLHFMEPIGAVAYLVIKNKCSRDHYHLFSNLTLSIQLPYPRGVIGSSLLPTYRCYYGLPSAAVEENHRFQP
jgi:hypothetical protein